MFFLDPNDVKISTGTQTVGVDLITITATLPTATSVIINTTPLVSQLNFTNVTRNNTATSGSEPNSGSITVSNALALLAPG